MLHEAVNHKLLAKGIVYPTFYRSLFADLRNDMTATAHKAQADGEGLWPLDKTQKPTVVVGPTEVSKDVILPKFNRRLGEYVLLNDGDPAFPPGTPAPAATSSSRSTTATSAGPTTSRTSSSTPEPADRMNLGRRVSIRPAMPSFQILGRPTEPGECRSHYPPLDENINY
ncbi:hypothetical protein ACWCPI_38350 [Streptomyces sp. NPDC001920]